MPLSVLPRRPSHWRPTCAVAFPSLRSPLSSITNTPSGWDAVAASAGNDSTRRALNPLGIPARLRQEILPPLRRRALGPGHRFSPGQRRGRLVPLPRRRQPRHILPDPAPLPQMSEQIIKPGRLPLQRPWRGRSRFGLGHRLAPFSGAPATPSPPSQNLDLTDYR